MTPLTFREATHLDHSSIIQIHNLNVRGQTASLDQGFLLAKTSETELQEKLDQGTRYFVAVDSTDAIVGFLAISQPTISLEFLDQIIWQDQADPHQLLNPHHIYIQIVATRWDCMGQGVAQFMYQSLNQEFPQFCFSTFIVAQPICNHRSIRFHQKQGFYHIGTIRRDVFLDFQNYESLLMFKNRI